MPAYVIADIEVTDAAAYEEYKKATPGSLAPYGGRFLVRGGAVEVLEGNWSPRRLILLEFENIERARAWWNSEEYRAAKALRHASSRGSLILVEGMPAQPR